MTATPGIRLQPCAVGGQSSVWPGQMNNNFTYADMGVRGLGSFEPLVGTATYTVVADGSMNDVARNRSFLAALQYGYSGTNTYTFIVPPAQKVGFVTNQQFFYNGNPQSTPIVVECLTGTGTTSLVVPWNASAWFWQDNSGNIFNSAPTYLASGATNGNPASPGQIGEVISSSVAQGSARTMTSGNAANVTSITLTAGDWDVWGTVASAPAGSTAQTSFQAGVSSASATIPSGSSDVTKKSSAFAVGGALALPTGRAQFNLSTPTIIYLVANIAFSGGTNAAYGVITARRTR